MRSRTPRFRVLLATVGLTVGAMVMGQSAGAAESATERLVHRYIDVDVSRDGALIASIEGDSPPGASSPVVRDLVIRRTADGKANTVTLPCGRVRECWPGSPAFTPDGKQISFTLRTPGSHDYDLYSVDIHGGHLTKLLAFEGTLRALKFGHDGQLAMLATLHAAKESGATEAGAAIAGDLDAAPSEQRIAILTGPGLRFASPEGLYVYEYDWRPDGQGFVGTASPGDGDDHWWIAKLYAFTDNGGAGEPSGRVIFNPVDSRQQLAEPTVSPDGRTVAVIIGLMSDFGSTGGDAYTIDLASGKSAINLTPALPASVTGLAWSCQGALRATLLAGGKTEIVDLGPGRAAGPPRTLWSGEETLRGRDAGVSAGCPSQVTATVHESFMAPPEIGVGKFGHWRDLTNANQGLHMAMRTQSLTWKSDGVEVQGWLLLPEHSSGKLPMITIVHGGPAAAAVPSFSGPGLISALLDRGYAVFRPNPRGSFGQGEAFTQANVRDFGRGDLRDILAGIDAAEKAYPIDDARLGITGGSYGGYMTMWAVTQTSRFKAAVAAAGVSDMLSYYGENGIDGWLIPYFGASAYEDPDVYARSSPITYIRNVRTPTFAWAGERDIECPPSQTREFWHALKTLGVPTSIMIYPGEGHGLRDPQHAADAVRRTVEWFDRYLGETPPPLTSRP